MARVCQITGKGPMVGNNVSHANNKTKRRFLPNLRTVRVTLEDGTTRKMRIAASTLRTLKNKILNNFEDLFLNFKNFQFKNKL